MSGRRLSTGGLIDRDRALSFHFEGRALSGHPGDTVASALLANGVRIVGRSFKYHRPRGVWGAWTDDPNAIFSIAKNGVELTNCPGATTLLEDGMEVKPVNVFPRAAFDIRGGLDRLHHFLPAGFYYKTFMWPDWHLFEPTIRRMAGLGAVSDKIPEGYLSPQLHAECDLLVVGAGPTGLAAARAAAETGQNVWLVDDRPNAGGTGWQLGAIEGERPGDWIAANLAAFRKAGGRFLASTSAYGVYDHKLVALAETRGFAQAPVLWRLRAARVLLATGAMTRPLTFPDNDRPGIMAAEAAAEYLARYGVLVADRLAVLSNNDTTGPLVEMLASAGAEIRQVDPANGLVQAEGGKRLRGLRQDGHVIAADAVLISGGLVPTLHLWKQAGGQLAWAEDRAAFVPGDGPGWLAAAGAANGVYDPETAPDDGRAAALGAARPGEGTRFRFAPTPPDPAQRGRQWVDFQNDVTLKDIALAARENYVSVEHLKRYTTLGMATDQGKTSNLTGLEAMAALSGRSIPETGTTTFRPPFVPVPLELYRGAHRGQQRRPLRRLALEQAHRALDAALGDYGGWLRPGWYGSGDPAAAARREVLVAREHAGIFDASPLGKIEVIGPDAAPFLDFIYYNTISTLKVGAIRYGFMLTEGGIVYDDGVVARLAADRFVVSCSSSHVDAVVALLEAWRQDNHRPDRVYVHDTTAAFATITITGPRARHIVTGIGIGCDLDPADFAHMTWRDGAFGDHPVRLARVSFTGDASYELTLPRAGAGDLWRRALQVGADHQACPLGLEAVSIMRAEKGYLIIGKDTDGETMPHDLGFGLPRERKRVAYIGDRGLRSAEASRPDRRQFVGLQVGAGEAPLATGAHAVERRGGKPRSSGIVTSSYHSPTLGRAIALGLVERGRGRMGETVEIWHLGKSRQATIVPPDALDPKGDRLDAG